MPYVDDLVERSIVKYHTNEADYELGRDLLRQEAIGMALTLAGVDFPVDYACQNLFLDVTQNTPNYWACRIIENAVDKWLASTHNGHFRPEESTSRVEMLAMVLSAAWVVLNEDITGYEYQDGLLLWQKRVIATWVDLGIVSDTRNFRAGEAISRAEAFVMVSNMFSYADKN